MTLKNNKIELPFKVIVSEVSGGFIDNVHSEFTGGINIVNYHEEKYGNFEQKPLQSPFTQQWVGGYSHRHVNLNLGNDNSENRKEAWHLDFNPAGVKFYSHKHRNSPPSYWSRDMLAKSPLNIKNIKTTTGSANIGNFSHNYEVVQTSGRRITNNLIVDGFIADGALTTQFITGSHNYSLPVLNSETGSKSIIVERFNAPGSKEESSRGALDREGEEMSPNIPLSYRNIKLRQPFYRQLRESTPQFGGSIHGVNRNTLTRAGKRLVDNGYVVRSLPSTDIQYKWIGESTISTPEDMGGYQSFSETSDGSAYTDIIFNTGSLVISGSNKEYLVDNFGIRSLLKEAKNVNLFTNTITNKASISSSFSEYTSSPYGFGSWTSIRNGESVLINKQKKQSIFTVQEPAVEKNISLQNTKTISIKPKRSSILRAFTEPHVTFKYKPLHHKLGLLNSEQNIGYNFTHTYVNNLSTFANKGLIDFTGILEQKEQFYDILYSFYTDKNAEIENNPIREYLGHSYSEIVWPKEENTGLNRIRTREAYYVDRTGFDLDGFDRQLGTQRVFWRDLQEDRRRSKTTDGGYYSSFNYLSTEEIGNNFIDSKQGPLLDNKFVTISGSFTKLDGSSYGIYNSISILENLSTKKDIFTLEGKISATTMSSFEGYNNELQVTRIYNNIYKRCWNLLNSGEFNSLYIDFYESVYSDGNSFLQSLGTIYRNTNYKNLILNLPKEENSYNDIFARTESDEFSLNPKVKYVSFIGGTEMNTGSVAQNPDNFSSIQDFLFSTNGEVHAFNKKDNFLYIGGNFTKAGTISAKNIARVNLLTGLWQSFPIGGQTATDNGTDNIVRAIEISGSDIYVAGDFENCYTFGNQTIKANSIARFNLETQIWHSLPSEGISEQDNGTGNQTGKIFALQLSGSDLYVGGNFVNVYNGSDLIDASNFARFNTTTKQWDDTISITNKVYLGGQVRCFKLTGNDLYIGGDFNTAVDPAVVGQRLVYNITKFDTTTNIFSILDNGLTDNISGDGYVTDIEIYGGFLYAVGKFFKTSTGSSPALSQNIAKYGISAGNTWTSVGDIASPENDGIYGYLPNPLGDVRGISLATVGDRLYIGNAATYRINNIAVDTGNIFSMDFDTEKYEKMPSEARNAGFSNGNVFALFGDLDKLYIGGDFYSVQNKYSTINNQSIVEWSPLLKEYIDTASKFNVINIDYFGQNFDQNDVDFSTIDNGLLRIAEEESGYKRSYDSYEDYVEEIKRAGKEYSIIPEFNISKQIKYYDENNQNFTIKNENFLSLDGISEKITALSASTSDIMKKQEILQEENSADSELEKITIKIDGIKKLIPYNGFYPQERTIQIANLYNDYIDKRLGGGTYNLNYYNDFFSDFVSEDVVSGSATNISIEKLGDKYVLIKNILSTLNDGSEITDFVQVENKLYVVGKFLKAGNIEANNIAVYDLEKKMWDSVPFGGNTNSDNGVELSIANQDPIIRKIIHNNGYLYIGGRFDTVYTKQGLLKANNIAKFHIASQQWSRLPDDDENGIEDLNLVSGESGVHSLAFYGGNLYVGGVFYDVYNGGTKKRANNIARYRLSDNRWYSIPEANSSYPFFDNGVGTTLTSDVVVRDLHVSGTDIYVGGQFNRISNSSATNYATMTPVNNIAVISSYNYNWNTTKTTSINTGYSGGVIYDIENSGSDIYVVGEGINKWDGTNWDNFGVNLQSFRNARKILFSGSDFYVAGEFETINKGGDVYYVNNIVKWNGSEASFNPIPSSSLPTVGNNSVGLPGSSYALNLTGSKLYIGGSFQGAGKDYDSDYITVYDTSNTSSWFSWDDSRIALYTSSANDITKFSLIQSSEIYNLTGNKSKLLNVNGLLYHFTSRQNFEAGNDGYILYNTSEDGVTWTDLTKLRIGSTSDYISGSGNETFGDSFDAIYDSTNKKIILAFSNPNESGPHTENGNIYVVTGSLLLYSTTQNVLWSQKQKVLEGTESYNNMGTSMSLVSCSAGYQVYGLERGGDGASAGSNVGNIWVTTSEDAETWSNQIYISTGIDVGGNPGIDADLCKAISFKDKSYVFFKTLDGNDKINVISSDIGNNWGSVSQDRIKKVIYSVSNDEDRIPDSISLAIEKDSTGEDARLHYSFTNSKNGFYSAVFQYSEILNGSSLDGEIFEAEDELFTIRKEGVYGGLASEYAYSITSDGRTIPFLITDFEDNDREFKIYSLKQEKSILYSLRVSGSEQTKSFKHAALEPFFGPGIIYNTIKSGLAVDWPCATGSDDSIVPYGNNTIVNAYYPQPIKMHEYIGQNAKQTSYGLLKSRIDYRIPFEYVLTPATAFIEKEEIKHDITSFTLNSLLAENDPVTTNIKGTYIYGAYEPFISSYDFSDINSLSPKRFSIPFVYSKSSKTGGETYTMAVSNFLAESINFFLKDSKMTVFKSNPDDSWKEFDSNKTYYMDIVVEKDSNLTMIEAWHSDKHPIGPNGEKMNGRYFGYPVNKTTKELWAGSQFTEEESRLIHNDPAYAPYTPPYFEGTAKARISFKPDSTRFYSLQEVLQKIEIENIFPGVSLGAEEDSDAVLNKMSINSSLNIRGSDNPTIVQVDETTGRRTIINNPDSQAWVITPRMETPVLDFSDSSTTYYEESYIKKGGFGKGMWSNYGKLSDSSIKIKLTYPYASENSPFTASLLENIGLDEQEQKIGQVANSKVISEAIILVPYLDDPKEEITIPSVDIETLNFIKIDKNKFEEQKIEFENLKSNKPKNSIQNMIQKMKNYIIPPNMNFLDYGEYLDPFVMYILEFNHVLSQQELVDIWQGILPESGRKMENHSVSLTHFAGEDEFFEGKQLPGNLKWLIFKVKKKGEFNYYNKREDLVGDERFNFEKLVGKDTSLKYSYNWPYDYCSLIEFAKVELTLDYKKKEQESN